MSCLNTLLTGVRRLFVVLVLAFLAFLQLALIFEMIEKYAFVNTYPLSSYIFSCLTGYDIHNHIIQDFTALMVSHALFHLSLSAW